MRYFLAWCISLYQRFISPHKGFRCAYDVCYQSGSCSYAIKSFLLKYGVIKSLPIIRRRLRQCREAAKILATDRADLSCDIGCADGAFSTCGELGSSSSSCDLVESCDFLINVKRLLARTKRISLCAFVVLVLAYWFYGRGISAVTVIDLGTDQQSVFTRLIQRNNPEIRVMLEADGKKTYSDIIELREPGFEYTFTFENALLDYEVERLTVLDARLNVADKLFVVGQILDEINSPDSEGQGQRFKYRLKRRWHFW